MPSILPIHVRPPRRRSHVLPRPQLVERITGALQSKQLVLLTAASGYGKTSILTDVYEQIEEMHGRPIWLNVMDGGHGAAWLSRGLVQQLASRLNAEAGSGVDFAALAHLLVDAANPVFVFIDNWNFLGDAAADQLFERILAETDGLVRFAISSRTPPGFNCEPQRLSGDLAEFGAADLAFSRAEAERLLCEGREPPPGLASLIERTEGWPAGVQLLRMALSQADASNALRLDFAGTRNDVARYIGRSYFNRLPPPRQAFLCDIALFDEFSADFVAEVLGAKAIEEFRSMLQDGAFVSETSHNSGSYRLHSLYREFLRDQRTPAQRDDGREVLRRACDYYRCKEDFEAAIPLAIEADLHEPALDMLREEGARLTTAGKVHKYATWVEALQANGASVPKDVARWHLWSLVFAGAWPKAVDRATLYPDAVDAEIRTVIAAFADDIQAMREGLAAWRGEREGQHPPFQSAVMHCAESIMLCAVGELKQAEHCLHRAEFAIEQTESAFGRAWVATLRALTELLRGRADLAENCIRRSISVAERALGPTAPVVSVARQMAAIIAWHRCSDEQVRRDLESAKVHDALDNIPFIRNFAYWVSGRLGLPGTSDVVSDAGATPRLAMLRRARSLGQDLQHSLSPREARNALEAYAVTMEEARAGVNPMHVDGWGLREMEVANQARVCLLARRPTEALALLSPALLRLSREPGNLLESTLALLKAAALDMNGDRTGAMRLLIRTTETVVSGDALRLIVNERRFLQPMLEALGEAGLSAPIGDPERWRRLSTLLGFERAREAATVVEVEALEAPTEREVRLLTLVEAGLSNKEIADRLGISVPTVKWHLYKLFTKMGVRNRGSAVRAARESGLFQ